MQIQSMVSKFVLYISLIGGIIGKSPRAKTLTDSLNNSLIFRMDICRCTHIPAHWIPLGPVWPASLYGLFLLWPPRQRSYNHPGGEIPPHLQRQHHPRWRGRRWDLRELLTRYGTELLVRCRLHLSGTAGNGVWIFPGVSIPGSCDGARDWGNDNRSDGECVERFLCRVGGSLGLEWSWKYLF